MSSPFYGQICIFAFTFAPRGWANCDGQSIDINQNQALFALIGTTYGGNGQTYFNLPDFRGRIPNHMGTGPGLSLRQIGEKSGIEKITLQSSQIPTHSHTVTPNAVETIGTSTNPSNAIFAQPASNQAIYDETNPGYPVMKPITSLITGGDQPHSNMQPFVTLRFCIALWGIFPSRN